MSEKVRVGIQFIGDPETLDVGVMSRGQANVLIERIMSSGYYRWQVEEGAYVVIPLHNIDFIAVVSVDE